MGRTVAVTTRPDPDAPGRQRVPGQPRRLTCRYLRRGIAGQCTAEALDDTAEVLLCARHTALVVEFYADAVRRLSEPVTGSSTE